MKPLPKTLSIVYITSRMEPRLDWFFDSLRLNPSYTDAIEIIIVDSNESRPPPEPRPNVTYTHPKPTIWQGPHRLVKEQWWAASNARNTGICLSKGEWIAFCDDRCVLAPTWLESIRVAMRQGYAVAGSYEKVHNLVVENGVIKSFEETNGKDSRMLHADPKQAVRCPREWWFGCTNALPLEWALAVDGYSEFCDSVSMEDVIFGIHLYNNNYPMAYDMRMKVTEDRTPGQCGPSMRREDKGKSPEDKSHAMLDRLKDRKTAEHGWEFDVPHRYIKTLREVRDLVQRGESFPVPIGPTKDWYDAQPITEL